ncbi:MAG: ATP-binding protein [Bacteroidales bacterium]|nr:ATP-binding protein [Bacteroidales bacterium]
MFANELASAMKLNLVQLLVPVLLVLFTLQNWSCTRKTKVNHQNNQETVQFYKTIHSFDSIVNSTKISDPVFAQSIANKALRMVSLHGDHTLNPNIYLMAGSAFQMKNPDSAYQYYQIAFQSAEANGNDTIKPRILYNLAMLYKNGYNYHDAVKMLDSAQRMAAKINDHITISNCFNSIGNIEADLKNEERAVLMFTIALQVAEENNLPIQTGVAIASLARFEKDEPKANLMRRHALNIFREQPDAREQTGYLLANIGDDCRDPDSAMTYYRQAREIGRSGHIVVLELAALNGMAYSYADKKNYPTALSLLIDIAIPLAIKEESTNWLSTLYDSYAEISYLTGHTDAAYLYQKKTLETATMADHDQASNQVRLLNALLQARSREIKILEQNNRIELQGRNVRLLTFFVIGLTILAAFLILLFIVYRQRKNLRIQGLEIDSAKTLAGIEEQEKERLSMQLHDLIRPVKNAISNHIETLESLEPSAKEELVSVLEKISGSLRQLSHRMNPVVRNKMGFSELCEAIRQDFALSSALSITMEISPAGLTLAPGSLNHVYFILYELLTNAEKHLGKGNVDISVSSEFDNLYILYKDDGQGFDSNLLKSDGLGITLVKKRVLLMGGQSNLHSDRKCGTRWTITIPAKGNIIRTDLYD